MVISTKATPSSLRPLKRKAVWASLRVFLPQNLSDVAAGMVFAFATHVETLLATLHWKGLGTGRGGARIVLVADVDRNDSDWHHDGAETPLKTRALSLAHAVTPVHCLLYSVLSIQAPPVAFAALAASAVPLLELGSFLVPQDE